METRKPRYNPEEFRGAERHPLTASVLDEVAKMHSNIANLQLSMQRIGGLTDLIQAAEDAKKTAERRNRPAA